MNPEKPQDVSIKRYDVSELNPKSIGDISKEEVVQRYSITAKVTVADNAGNVLFDEYAYQDEIELEVIKGEVLLDPTFKTKMSLAKKNPEKQKRLIQRRIDKAGTYIEQIPEAIPNEVRDNDEDVEVEQ